MRKLELRKLQRRAARPAPALPASRPRPVRLTGLGWFVAVFGMLLLAGAPVAGFWLHATAVRGRTLRETIDKEAVAVTAVVSELTRTRGKNQRHYVNYEYAAAGQVHEGRASVSRGSWTRLKVGSSLTVRYLPSEPGRSWLRGREPGGVPFWLGPVVALSMAVIGMFPWYGIRRQWMLLAEGRPAQAQVTVLEESAPSAWLVLSGELRIPHHERRYEERQIRLAQGSSRERDNDPGGVQPGPAGAQHAVPAGVSASRLRGPPLPHGRGSVPQAANFRRCSCGPCGAASCGTWRRSPAPGRSSGALRR